jgi:IS1 family transposase
VFKDVRPELAALRRIGSWLTFDRLTNDRFSVFGIEFTARVEGNALGISHILMNLRRVTVVRLFVSLLMGPRFFDPKSELVFGKI